MGVIFKGAYGHSHHFSSKMIQLSTKTDYNTVSYIKKLSSRRSFLHTLFDYNVAKGTIALSHFIMKIRTQRLGIHQP